MSVTDYSRSTARRIIGDVSSWGGVSLSSNSTGTAGYIPVAQSSNSAAWLDAISFGSNATDITSFSSEPKAGIAISCHASSFHTHRGVASVTHSSNTMYGSLTLVPAGIVGITSTPTGTITISAAPPTSVATITHASNTQSGALTLTTPGNSIAITEPVDGTFALSGMSITVASNTYTGPVTLRTPRGSIAITHAGANVLDLTHDSTPGTSLTGTIGVPNSGGSNFAAGALAGLNGRTYLQADSQAGTTQPLIGLNSSRYANGATAGAIDLVPGAPSNAIMLSGQVSFMSDTQTNLTGTQNNVAVPNSSSVLRWSPASAATATGIAKSDGVGGEPADGRILFVQNTGTATLTLAHESSSSSTANRIICPGGINFHINPGGGVVLQYDVTSGRWRVLAAEPSIGEGTAFPTGPSTNQRFYRTDLGGWYYYDGTRWLSVTLYDDTLAIAPSSLPLTATTGAALRLAPAAAGANDLWLVDAWASFYAAGGTALDASNKWVLTFVKQNAGTTFATINIDSGASSTWRTSGATAIGALLGTSNVQIEVNATKTGTPGNLYVLCRMRYRIVAT